jgi:phytoene/squalene synthetase
MKNTILPSSLSASITKAASNQTFYTIRFLVDRGRVADAYNAYAYFRWVDDTLDADPALPQEHRDDVSGVAPRRHEVEAQARIAFLHRQKSLLEKCYGHEPLHTTAEEEMLIDLVRHDHEKNSGLHSYLHNMMKVMEFDAKRRGRLISQSELTEYTRWLATAVTEAMHYFIGHNCHAPRDETRYLAVTGAHIVHMLRDTFDDLQAGYYNIPREVLEATGIQPQEVHSSPYRDWVQGRVNAARQCFERGRSYLERVQNPRCRLAGLAYMARFEWLLDAIEQEGYVLRPRYPERKSLATGLRMGLSSLATLIHVRERKLVRQPAVWHLLRKL